ncbi:MAG: NAD(P)/FAD-dependent oxidoreductase [Bacteroidales bacterium]
MHQSKLKVVVLGAGFGGLELTATLSEKMGEQLDLILIDRNDFFFFGYTKLDVMFGHKTAKSVKHSYSRLIKPGVNFRQETITSIDPVRRRVSTDQGSYEADVLVIALGADYDIDATPGLDEGGYEFYSFRGAERVREVLSGFTEGHILIGVTGHPFKCPPAPSETALLLHEYLTRRGIRSQCRISLVMPFELPVPPSYGTSKELLKHFHEKEINYVPEIMVGALDPGRKVAELDDGREIPFDLFLGIPEHCVPRVLEESGLLFDGWVPVDRNNLKTKFPGVYAIGDVTSVGTPKAGLFAMSAARSAAASIIADFNGQEFDANFAGEGSCYVEFGEGKVGRADVKFFPDPAYPEGSHKKASTALAREKQALEEQSRIRWFGN